MQPHDREIAMRYEERLEPKRIQLLDVVHRHEFLLEPSIPQVAYIQRIVEQSTLSASDR